MDITGILPVWLVLACVVVVGVTQYVKKADTQGKLKSIYIFLPVVLSILAGVALAFAGSVTWRESPFYMAVIFSVATLAYNQIIKRVKG